MKNFKEITTDDAIGLINEADSLKAFLPSCSDPNFTVTRFLTPENFPGFQLFGVFNENNEIMSFVSTRMKDSQTLVIGPMYVGKEFRKQGIGKRQVEALLDWSKNSGIKTVTTKTWKQNAGSRKIFEDLGFEITEEEPNARINGDSTLKYQKRLN